MVLVSNNRNSNHFGHYHYSVFTGIKRNHSKSQIISGTNDFADVDWIYTGRVQPLTTQRVSFYVAYIADVLVS